MEDLIMWIKLMIAALCGGIIQVLGGVDLIFKVLLVLMALDYITGISAAVVGKRLSSKIGFNGILKKVTIVCIVAVGRMTEQILGFEGVRSAVICFYIANEMISITENAVSAGVPLPQRLTAILQQLQKKEDSGDDV